ncbi:MAG: hypothetical protein NWF03_01000 [Candidatus Bathyarchaeota archaeon]|nr:hypothetical protein [Candidatus Bathyarchaeota archaeon]
MAKSTKLAGFLTIFLLCSITFSIQAPKVQAEFEPAVEKLLDFFEEVLMINMSECTVSVFRTDGDNSPELGTRGEKEGKISLHFNNGGTVEFLFRFKGEYLRWCLAYYDTNNTNPIVYTEQPSDDHFEATLNFMERYENFTKDPIISEMKELLISKGNLQPGSKVEDKLKLEVTGTEIPDATWSYTIENEDYKILSVGFFEPPHIFSFGDQRWNFNLNSSAFPKYIPEGPNVNSEFTTGNEYSQTENSFDNSSIIMLAIITVPALAFAAFFIKEKHKKTVVDKPSAFACSKNQSRKKFGGKDA